MPELTWRRFLVLIRGLSPNSATVASMRRGVLPESRKVHTVEGPEATQRAFVALFGAGSKAGRKPS